MDKFVINGPNRLEGKIRVGGSKNAALPIIAAALLIDKGETVIRNVPPLQDIYTLKEMLEYILGMVPEDLEGRFFREYFALDIDIHNLLTFLRLKRENRESSFDEFFILGGEVRKERIKNLLRRRPNNW